MNVDDPTFNKLRAADWRRLLQFAGETGELAGRLFERREWVARAIMRMTGAFGVNLFELDLPAYGF